ncbi:putative cytochrome p450 144 [Luminiphilus syltensis NOR5-1B]|uniref:Putative cytochrome p450 144 n=1 Tax=Luminiphilus syltensis NOR5-1B TaxID=565045 RepID=B8KXY2_9GAMM|nr:cytochrome P450 [Luminiphilus syltensis]EED34398.1 putative cytochrome p450 144 [Luminiphilus syltensis NOR5-1B]
MSSTSIDLFDPDIQRCPWEAYRSLRKNAPIYRMEPSGIYLITSYALCEEVIRQPDLFISGVSPMALRPGGVPEEVLRQYTDHGWLPRASCSTSDPPEHTRVRDFLQPLFTAKRIRAYEPRIREIAESLAGQLKPGMSEDFVALFSHPLPMQVIADLLGVPDGDLGQFKVWSDAIVEPFSMMISEAREVECAALVVEMQHYFKNLLEQRLAEPQDDMLTEVAQAGEGNDGFNLEEQLTILTIDLLASGNETTTAAISSGMHLLCQSPDLVGELQGSPDKLRNFCEEAMRLESPAQGMFRQVTRKTELGGVTLNEGDLLNLRFGAANRDESRYDRSEELVLDRPKPGQHLAFGTGRHVCVGAALARAEMQLAFQALLQRFNRFELAPDHEPPAITPSFFGRNIECLHIIAT